MDEMRKVNDFMRKDQNGFTLAELLIVVAIVAVLVGVSIPIFTSQLEKSREATDLANVRNAYSEVMMAALVEDTSSPLYQGGPYQLTVPLKQAQNGWQMNTDKLMVGGISCILSIGNPQNCHQNSLFLEREFLIFVRTRFLHSGVLSGASMHAASDNFSRRT